MKIGGFFIALVFALAACSSAPQPREPTATTTPAPAPSSTATAPAMPAQATEDSPEGAAAFVVYWVAAFNYAQSTGITAGLEALSASECTGCQSYIRLFGNAYSNGGYIEGNSWTAGRLKIDYGVPETYLTTTVSISGGTSRQSADASPMEDSPTEVKLSFAIQRKQSEWHITQLALGEAE